MIEGSGIVNAAHFSKSLRLRGVCKTDKMFTIKQQHVNEINAQIRMGWPLEICGYLGGVGGHVQAVYPVNNIAANPDTGFVMEPQSQLNAMLGVEDNNTAILAVYHTHPVGTRSDPSDRDRAGFAELNCLYVVIVPNENRVIDSLRVFRLEGGKSCEVPIKIETETEHPGDNLI